MVEREFVAQYMTYVIGLSQKQIKKMAAQGITARTLLKDICGRTIPADMSIEELLQKIGSAVAVRLSRAFESAR
ncbi:MAG TPA: hypothetical protein VMU25_03095 [Candidatus Paceibacterota bacterium]|nr:hypothetical protein [Candidatus Paceibacterota bacterium]